jgi:hypothetical protein
LCLNIVAEMISESAENWEEEVLPELRTDTSQFMSDAGSSSIQDTIIVGSLKSITGKDLVQVKELFGQSAIFAGKQLWSLFVALLTPDRLKRISESHSECFEYSTQQQLQCEAKRAQNLHQQQQSGGGSLCL